MTEPHDDRRGGNFAEFTRLWNEGQGQKTPDHHRRIVVWLERHITAGSRGLLLTAFRGAGKSTVVGLFAAWLLLSDPNRRLMVVGADEKLAARMVRNARRVIETHPETEVLRPRERGSWRSAEFTVPRPMELREPSMTARGVLANITGSRADVVICDDVEVPRTCDTAPKRAALRERLNEIDYVLTPGGTQLYIGTPHTYYSIYAETPRAEIGEERPFLDGFERLAIPVLQDGVSAWEERFSLEHIERLRKRTGPAKFETQMMLRPLNLTRGRLDPDLLRPYHAELVEREAAGRTIRALSGVRLLSASCWWDPSFASEGGDGSVVAVVFGGEDKNLYLHRVLYLRAGGERADPEATRQCAAVVELVRELGLPGVAVETNGVGGFLPGLLREAMGKAGLASAVIGVASHTPKDRRIVEALDAPLAAGRLFAHRSVWDTPLVREMREWRPDGRSKVHDDGLDAVAGAVAREPLRFDRSAGTGTRPNWGTQPLEAPTDWHP